MFFWPTHLGSNPFSQKRGTGWRAFFHLDNWPDVVFFSKKQPMNKLRFSTGWMILTIPKVNHWSNSEVILQTLTWLIFLISKCQNWQENLPAPPTLSPINPKNFPAGKKENTSQVFKKKTHLSLQQPKKSRQFFWKNSKPLGLVVVHT